MANLIAANMVAESTVSTGTGDIALSGAIDSNHSTFTSRFADGALVPVMVFGNGAWMALEATYNSGANSLTRTNFKSSSTGSTISLSGTNTVLCAPLAEHLAVGKQMIPIMAGGMKANTTNGATAGSLEMTTNLEMLVTLDFSPTTAQSATFVILMPAGHDLGPVSFKPIWSHPSTTTNFGVVWELAGVAISDGDAGDAAFGTGQTSTDTGGTTNTIYIGPESAAITIAGTPAVGDIVFFRMKRLPANASDTMAVNARLHGIKLFVTVNKGAE